MSEQKSEIFEKLKELRLKKKITLKQISESTKIHLKYLEALEEGNLLEIPEIYDKLFFKSYLKVLDADEADFYDDFIDYRKTIREDRTAILDMTQTESTVEKEFNYRNLFYFVPIIFAILIIWFLISNTLIVEENKTDSIPEISVIDIAEELQSKIDSSKISEQKSKKDSISASEINKLALKINALEQTWFRVVVDQIDTTEYLLRKGQNISLESAKSFDFLIGKANGLIMTLNDSTFGPFGNSNQVVRYMRLDSNGISNLILKVPQTKENQLNEEL